MYTHNYRLTAPNWTLFFYVFFIVKTRFVLKKTGGVIYILKSKNRYRLLTIFSNNIYVKLDLVGFMKTVYIEEREQQ